MARAWQEHGNIMAITWQVRPRESDTNLPRDVQHRTVEENHTRQNAKWYQKVQAEMAA
jgi:hypothetical protein